MQFLAQYLPHCIYSTNAHLISILGYDEELTTTLSVFIAQGNHINLFLQLNN